MGMNILLTAIMLALWLSFIYVTRGIDSWIGLTLAVGGFFLLVIGTLTVLYLNIGWKYESDNRSSI